MIEEERLSCFGDWVCTANYVVGGKQLQHTSMKDLVAQIKACSPGNLIEVDVCSFLNRPNDFFTIVQNIPREVALNIDVAGSTQADSVAFIAKNLSVGALLYLNLSSIADSIKCYSIIEAAVQNLRPGVMLCMGIDMTLDIAMYPTQFAMENSMALHLRFDSRTRYATRYIAGECSPMNMKIYQELEQQAALSLISMFNKKKSINQSSQLYHIVAHTASHPV